MSRDLDDLFRGMINRIGFWGSVVLIAIAYGALLWLVVEVLP